MIHSPAVLAQISEATSALLAYGPLGIICLWFLVRVEKFINEMRKSKDDLVFEIRNYGHKIDGLRLALLGTLVESSNSTEAMKKFYVEEITRIQNNLERKSDHRR